MCSYKDKNYECLRTFRPRLYEAIEKHQYSGIDKVRCDFIEEKPAKVSGKYLTVSVNGKTARLNSAFKPYEEAQKWNEQYNYRNLNTVVTLFGMGNGIFAEQILDSLADDAKLFIVEPSFAIFDYMLERADFTTFIKEGRIFFIFNEINPLEFHLYLGRYIHWSNIKSYHHCCHPGYDTLFPEDYKAYLEEICSTTDMAIVNMHTGSYFGKALATNSIKNLVYIKDGISTEEIKDDIDLNLPAIIVSAGPSLDKNIHLLKEIKNRAYIIATDTGVQHLLKRQIMPDAMVTLDPKKPARYMEYDEIQNIPLFCALEANNKIMKMHHGKKIWFRSGDYLSKMYERFGGKICDLNPGGSVATAAFSICVGLGFKRIVLIGQDLAYGEHSTHAGGLDDHVLNEEYGIKMIDGIDGKPIKSRYDWIIYRDWFESAIKEVPDVDVIDATEGGALIHGSKVMTLQQVIQDYCKKESKPFCDIVAEKKSFHEQEYGPVKEYLLQMRDEIEEIQKTARKAYEVAEKVYKTLSGGMDIKEKDFHRYSQKITEATAGIEKTSIWLLLDLYIADKVTKYMANISVVSDDERQDMIELFYSSMAVFQAVDKSVDEIRDVINETADIIEEQG